MDYHRLSKAMEALGKLVEHLRGPGGCPWDARQTDDTITVYLLEEAYEVLDAVESASPSEVCEELGDLLFQIFFLAHLARERNEYDLVDVAEKIHAKMVRRHPHVFDNVRVNSAADVGRNWARIKRAEKEGPEDMSSRLRRLPVNLPTLLKAHRLSERASKVDFGWSREDEIWETVEKQFQRLKHTMTGPDTSRFGEIMGDLLFSLTHLARDRGLNADTLMRDGIQRFLDRFESMEGMLKASGIEPDAATRSQKEQAWKGVTKEPGQ
jgi:tetrapyrrole methylase family protein/MazG family protein